MQFERIKITKQNLEKLLPAGVRREIGTIKPFIYGAVYNTKIIGAAVFTVAETGPAAGKLHYVTVDRSFRGQGLSKQLLEYAFSAVRNARGRYVFARKAAEEAGDLLEFSELSESYGFVPISMEETIYIYDRDQFQDCPFLKEVLSGKKELPPVTAFSDPGDPVLLSFNGKGEFGLLSLSDGFYDLDLCRFYVNENRILSGVLAKREEKDLLSLTQISCDPVSMNRKKILPQLLVHAIEAGCRDKNIRKICITLSDSVDADKAFGKPEKTIRTLNFVRYL